jgi:hypothetical protein
MIPSDPLVLVYAFGGLLGMPYLAYRHRSAFLMLALCTICVFIASNAHRIWPMIEELRLSRLPLVMAWFAIFPCVLLLDAGARFFARHFGGVCAGALWLILVLSGLATLVQIPENWRKFPHLAIGLNSDRVAVLEHLKSFPATSRIIWEDSPADRKENGWTALLSSLTNKQYLGGLEPESRMEHFYARLVDGKLAGKDIRFWTDDQLDHFFKRYNAGRIVARSEAAISRLRNYPNAFEEKIDQLDHLPIRFFTLGRQPSFFLKGKGRIVELSYRRIVLADLEPDHGEIILSLHYQQGWVVSPQFVEVERQLDAYDPIPFTRLWLPGPVTLLVLEWHGP